MKIPTAVLALVVLASLGAAWYWMRGDTDASPQSATGYKNATYIIEGKPVTLVNGHAETAAAPDSAAKIVTDYFGNDVKLDLNGDGREDIVFLLTQQTGGSGTFYYVVAALNKADGWQGSQGVLLGDRIAPQTTEKGKGTIVVVNYADRAPGESFAVRPSIGKSIWLLLDPATMQFGEVAQDFEGEADPSRMTLDMQTWTWISTLYNDDTKVMPKQAKAFTLTFKKDGTFSATTDCNSMSGAYTTKQGALSFERIAMTKMYCAGSQESNFARMLEETRSYFFTSKGELVFDLEFDSGSVIFR